MRDASTSGETIGFVGLGQMGGPMSRRLLDVGYSVVVYDSAASACEPLADRGASVGADAVEVARCADVIFVMVPARHVSEALMGERGLLAGIRPNAVVIEGGNSDPAESARFATTFERAGATMIDVGFSGGPRGAADGQLAMMVGGPKAAFDRIEPILRTFGTHIGYFGASGTGHLAKALNHLVQGLTAQAIGEALSIGQASGLDIEEWVRIVSCGAAGSWLMDRTREMLDQPPPAPAEVTAWWGGHGARNQLSYALEAAEKSAIAVPLTATGHEIRVLSLGAGRSTAMEFYVRLTWTLAHS